jgi:murein DD-endopeptidase MepM/ murein hydrolase activator NlpD
MMARPITPERDSPVSRQAVGMIAVLGILVVIGGVALSTLLGGGTGTTGPRTTPGAAANGPTPSAKATVGGGGQGAGQGSGSGSGAGRTARPNGATPTPGGSIRPPRATPTPDPQPTDTPPALPVGAAPTSPADFDLVGQVIPIGFPLLADTKYHYRNNFLDFRTGAPDGYNHSRVRDGKTERLHDGIDIYAGLGQPLVAPFDGVVIDPRTRWQPWERMRYGRTIVIASDEPTSEGYVALFAHAEDVWVEVGQHVTRGQVVGSVGRTGNAIDQSFRPHVHFELRAPFLLDWSALGEDHAIDAFNPYPSLVEADPAA